jgi:2-polyprenyl-6-hydroxyphenyl methylase/3-demethylubiquinone-9 3-methyltransferase
MIESPNELAVENHFEFGKNWQSFARLLDDRRIQEAVSGLERLFPDGELKDKHFLDIGSGSGLSTLAAARLGVAAIEAIDIDPNSVSTTRAVLEVHAGNCRWSAGTASVFDLDPAETGRYDVVHSWGVLHHTGDMWRAVRIAASLVKPGGLLAVALYRKTVSCPFWKAEKKFYAHAPRAVRAAIRTVYASGYFLDLLLRKRCTPWRHIREYRRRGMDWWHDLHDWLGGYPYESAAPEEVRSFLRQLGFTMVREFVEPNGAWGLWGSGCDEFVARRTDGKL